MITNPANLQTVFTATKIIALIVIIIAGLVVMCVGEVNNLADPFAVTRKDTGVEDQNGRY